MYKGDVSKLPFEDNFFDTIIAISTLEHVGLGSFGDPLYKEGDFEAVKELRRVLREDGRMFITVPFANSHTITWQRFYDQERILKLAAGFLIEKEDFYSRHQSGWKDSDLEKSKQVKFDSNVNTIVCLKLRKGS